MAYDAHTWATGDTITADLLNASESGISAAAKAADDAKTAAAAASTAAGNAAQAANAAQTAAGAAVTPAKLSGYSADMGHGKLVQVKADGSGFDFVAMPSTTPADGSITAQMLSNDVRNRITAEPKGTEALKRLDNVESNAATNYKTPETAPTDVAGLYAEFQKLATAYSALLGTVAPPTPVVEQPN